MTNYDDIAAAFDSYDAEAITDIALGHANIINLLGSCKDLNILEYGCGTGKVCRYLTEQGARLTGVDISAKEIDVARAKGGAIDYRVIRSAELDELPNDYDAVVLSFVLCTIDTKAEVVRIMKSCAAKMKKGGRLVILNNNPEASGGREFVSFAMERLDVPKSGQKFRTRLGLNRDIEVVDVYWSDLDYLDAMTDARLKLRRVIQPIATAGEGWKDETSFPPFKLFLAHKL